ncbi:MAG: S41 family peptidase [Pseudanabaenales cyanobacterium]|nr:S41 family peptidase [Pseudanabaenales cyanobacterium]
MQQLNLRRPIRFIAISLTGAFILILCRVAVPNLPSTGQPQLSTFEQVWQTVNENFYDPDFNGVNWSDIKAEYQPLANQVQSQVELAQIINQMLSELQTSHTHFYTPEDPAYYQLLGIFFTLVPEMQQQLEGYLFDGKPQYSGIGVFTKQQGDNTFVRAVLDGSPAAASGLLVGDQLLSVEGQPFHPIKSFLGKAEQPVKLLIQRSPDSQTELTVTPQMLDGTEMFLDAMKASVQVIEQDSKQIGYVHLWSYAGEKFHKQLKRELFYDQLKDVDGFILDLRDGWGGASASYLNIYSPKSLSITGTARDRPPSTSNSAWSKPVVMLVNEGSRSGKEVHAYGFRKHGIGPVVGARTAGAVVNTDFHAEKPP